MAEDTWTFRDIDAAAFGRLKARIRSEQGIEMYGREGRAAAKGFRLSWYYDDAGALLHITCEKKPRLIFMSLVARRIREFVEEAAKVPA